MDVVAKGDVVPERGHSGGELVNLGLQHLDALRVVASNIGRRYRARRAARDLPDAGVDVGGRLDAEGGFTVVHASTLSGVTR